MGFHKSIVISHATRVVKTWNKYSRERLNSAVLAYYNLQVIIGETIDKATSGAHRLLLPGRKLLAQIVLE